MPSEGLGRLHADPQFIAVPAVARIVDSILYTGRVVRGHRQSDSPSGHRRRSPSFLYSAALLSVALAHGERAGQHLNQGASLTRELALILRDPEVIKLRSDAFRRLRNQAVFHHDDG